MKNQALFNLIILIAFMTFFSCQETKNYEEPNSSDYSEQIKKIIDEKNAQIQSWYAAGLIDSVALHFADNCIQMPPNQPALVGIESFKEAWNQNIQFGKWEFELLAQEVKASGDIATELGKYTLSFTPNENSPIPTIVDKGNYVVLWEKINDDWKIVWDAPVSELSIPNQINEITTDE